MTVQTKTAYERGWDDALLLAIARIRAYEAPGIDEALTELRGMQARRPHHPGNREART